MALLRVMIPGCDDVSELRMEGGRWVDEEGRRVSIEAMLCRPAVAMARTMGAGTSF